MRKLISLNEDFETVRETLNKVIMHDSKSPWYRIKMLTEVNRIIDADKTKTAEEKLKEMMEISESMRSDAIKNISRINCILLSMQIEDGWTALVVENFSLWHSLRALRKSFLKHVSYLGYKITINHGPDKTTIRKYLNKFSGNQDLIESIFHNLINNALAAIPSKLANHRKIVQINIDLDEARAGWLKFSIRNPGTIPKDLRENFLEQVKIPRQETSSGYGVSLSTALVKYHEGEIDFKTDDNNNSTSITVWLPSYH